MLRAILSSPRRVHGVSLKSAHVEVSLLVCGTSPNLPMANPKFHGGGG